MSASGLATVSPADKLHMIDELIESHLGYAHALAAQLAGSFPTSITRTDLKGAAEFGLVQAAHSYDPSKRVSFATFAYYRIRGAIFDEVRGAWQASHLKSPGLYSSLKESTAREHLAGPSRVDSKDSVSLRGSRLISLENAVVQQPFVTTESPADAILREEESETIREAIERLPKRHQFVLWAHYYEDRSLADISLQLNLSKSWVSRLHSQALVMIRKILMGQGEDQFP